MVRQVMRRVVVGCALCGAVLACPSPARAADGDGGALDAAVAAADAQPTVGNEEIGRKLDSIQQSLTPIVTYVNREMAAEDEAVASTVEDVSQDVVEGYLGSIDEKLTQIVGQGAEERQVESEPLRASVMALVAYSNVSPTSTYANYAIGTLPKMGWSDHYVFVQDAQNAYTLVWGDITMADSTTFTLSDCKYTRFYYQSQQVGYQMEGGTCSGSITTRGYVVLSDLGDWPMLPDSNETLRKEVGFYAVVAAALLSLRAVWSFVVRNRNGTTS